jgi:hypothetical protein
MVDGKNYKALKAALTKLQVGNYLPIGTKSSSKSLEASCVERFVQMLFSTLA